jgi:hypothetical protein
MGAELTVPKPKSAALPASAMPFFCSRSVQLAGLALLFTLLNAFKPLQVDDGAYFYYARQLANNPLQPYGFDMFWYQWPHPANEVLAPPVLPYWWSLAIVLFGDNVFLWKLWLFPFSWLFVWSLAALLRRFARGVHTPLLWMTVLSPTFLPSLNLMLDVPALALGLGAVVVFMRAAARDSFTGAGLAGLLAALSMQTKYTGLLIPVVILLYGFLFRHRLLALATAGVAVMLFAVWELLVTLQHGQSHFLYHLHEADAYTLSGSSQLTWWGALWQRIDAKLWLALPFFPIVGGLTPPLTLLGLVALGVRRWAVALVGVLLLGGYLVVAAVEAPFNITWLVGEHPSTLLGPVTLEQAIFSAYCLLFLITMAVVLWRLWARDSVTEAPGSFWRCYVWSARLRADYFLLFWLGVELAGYFALTPFPAVRRVMGLIVVSTLLLGRLAARSIWSSEPLTATEGVRQKNSLLVAVAGAGITLGLMFYVVDMHDAFAEKRAAEAAARFIRNQDPTGRIWYIGHWGFQHYAERAGMEPVVPSGVPGRLRKLGISESTLHPGDWLVKPVPDTRPDQQRIRVDRVRARFVVSLPTEDPVPVPLRTVQCFYGGFCPLEHHEGPRFLVEIYRVTENWVPESDW